MTDREAALIACADAVSACGEAIRRLVKVEAAAPGVQLLRSTEVADLLGVSRRMVTDLISSGRIASVKVGRLRRVPVSAVESYQQRRRSE